MKKLFSVSLSMRGGIKRSVFFKIDWTIWPWSGRTWRKDRCSPSLSYGADLNPISLVVNYRHRSRLRTRVEGLTALTFASVLPRDRPAAVLGPFAALALAFVRITRPIM